ncbi:hypothetical protein SKAU_G00140420 [Synaphobranchus kaupii]|uniref:Uncharacterized protein n=1 Tax=Synaphobranchus kaupii TaxID=118154 RepID=A0A9Q1J3Y5_SYNKA|nr:hypothetical protein SKAU_G00140420 [Synaphobranchus kaupii]
MKASTETRRKNRHPQPPSKSPPIPASSLFKQRTGTLRTESSKEFSGARREPSDLDSPAAERASLLLWLKGAAYLRDCRMHPGFCRPASLHVSAAVVFAGRTNPRVYVPGSFEQHELALD